MIKMSLKNINLGKIKFFTLVIFILTKFQTMEIYAQENIYFGKYVDIKILDKLSSKSKLLKLTIGDDLIFKNLSIKVLKCKNSKFDDNPEITSYLQVRDLNNADNNEVFVFNGWTFSSSPSIQSFDHPVYDLWILKCY
tara:strand:+ start:1383 stop:1796 length:414 start_codon:yes stop_codon:yes gene_type:complete